MNIKQHNKPHQSMRWYLQWLSLFVASSYAILALVTSGKDVIYRFFNLLWHFHWFSLIVSSKTTKCLTNITVASRNDAFLVVQSVSKTHSLRYGAVYLSEYITIVHLNYSNLFNLTLSKIKTIVLSNDMIYPLICLPMAHKFKTSGNS